MLVFWAKAINLDKALDFNKKSPYICGIAMRHHRKREPLRFPLSGFTPATAKRKYIQSVEEKIVDLLEVKFKEPGFTDCFLIETKMGANKRLQVFIDSDEGINFATCRKISRYLEEHIDTQGWLGEKYVLEVSSPGVDRPLVMERQYPKNVGRKLEVKVKEEDKARKGILKVVEPDHIVLEEERTVKQGKKKKKEKVEVEIPFDQIEQAKVKISF